MNLKTILYQNYNSHLSDCIGIYDDVISKEKCNEIIEFTDSSLQIRVDDHRKQSREVQLIGDPRPEARLLSTELLETIYPYGDKFERSLWDKCHEDYKPEDYTLTESYKTNFSSLQIQKYTPEDKGYPAVHVEQGGDKSLIRRYLAVILYLNDIEEGGETIFPMCGTSVEPVAGRLAIWPSGIPFYHCGLPTVKQDKYIITSWFEFLLGL